MEEPVMKTCEVAPRMVPSKWDPAPKKLAPEMAHTMLSARAPPSRTIFLPPAMLMVPALGVFLFKISRF
jgi:hypothetical protein